MACFRPIDAWQLDSGEVVFAERGKIRRSLTLPCGQCVGCRLERSRQWAIRCMHETAMHDASSFVTLTYDDNHLPTDNSLSYRDFQLFMKRLRAKVGSVRFYMCGEYGEQFSRPHFHACIFGFGFPDRVAFSRSSSGCMVYRSPLLESLWSFGYSSLGDVTFESAAYVARYVMKKVTGRLAASHYEYVSPITGEIISRTPEFCRMSLKPGIGANWFKKFTTDVTTTDSVVLRGGMQSKPPRYYDKLLANLNPEEHEYLEVRRSNKVTDAMIADSS